MKKLKQFCKNHKDTILSVGHTLNGFACIVGSIGLYSLVARGKKVNKVCRGLMVIPMLELWITGGLNMFYGGSEVIFNLRNKKKD